MRDAILSNALADLAEQAKLTVQKSVAAEQISVEMALSAGQMLVTAKDQCQHGEWLPFLERTEIHERQAQRLMQLARSGLEPDTVSDLGGISQSLRFASTWAMPQTGKALAILDRRYDPDSSDDPGPVAFVWESVSSPGHFRIAAVNRDDVCGTRFPMRPLTEVEGERPISTIIHWLRLNFALPIADWEIQLCDRAFAEAMASPLEAGAAQ